MSRTFQAVLFVVFAFLQPSGTCLAQDAQVTYQWDVYSPSIVMQNGQYVMYFGGWDKTQEAAWLASGQPPQDTIYRVVCNSPSNCPNPQPVIKPQDSGLNLINDPSVVDTGHGYYIMYMTTVAVPGTTSGFTITNNEIYFSTSWTNDGVNWSAPQLLLSGDWLPSATLGPAGNVLLYANSNVNGQLYRYDLTASGMNPDNGTLVKYFDADGSETPSYYVNVDIAWVPQISLYQMLGQTADESRVDYLYSSDGINFTLARQGVITAPAGQVIVTPVAWPGSFCWVNYGLGPDEYHFNIFFHQWC